MAPWYSIILLICAVCIPTIHCRAEVYNMHQGQTKEIEKSFSNRLSVFCYAGKPKYIIHLWQSVLLKINHPTNVYNRYDAPTSDLIEKFYLRQQYSWSFFAKDNSIKLNPFNDTCVGIDTYEPYKVTLSIIQIDLWKILYLTIGAFLFLYAKKLSKNTIFYYACGIVIGVCASFAILVYFVSKLFPRKLAMYTILGGGSTVVLYTLSMIWDNIRTIVELYKIYLLWYIACTALISFIVIYRWGTVENERTKNLMCWSLQLIGLVLVFFSSHFQEAAMAQVILLVLFHYMPKTFMQLPKRYWLKKFPPKVKVLTNDEYYEQGVKETRKALDELRQFCSSPDCNQWKMALKLQNVKRFASFIEGNSHLSDEEVLEYETSVVDDGLTEDEASYTDDEF